MTKTKNRIGSRAIALLLAALTIITLVFSLSACGETTEKFRKPYADETTADYVAVLIARNESYKLRFIAASRGYDISPKENETVLDVGTGNGVIMACLNARIKNLSLTALDCQSDLLTLAQQNAVLNHFSLEQCQHYVHR